MITVLFSDILNRAAELAGRTRDKIPLSEAVMMQGFIAVDLSTVWNKEMWPELIPDPVQVSPAGRLVSKNEWNGPAPAGTITANLSFVTPATHWTAVTTAPHGLLPGATITIAQPDPDNPTIFALFIGTFTIATVTDTTHFTVNCVDQNSAFGNNGVAISRLQEMGDVLGVFDKDPTQTTKARPIYFEEANGYLRLAETMASVFVEYMLPRPDLNLLATVSGFSIASYAVPARFSNYLALRAAGLLLGADSPNGGGAQLGLAESALREEINRIVLNPRRRAVGPRRGINFAAQ